MSTQEYAQQEQQVARLFAESEQAEKNHDIARASALLREAIVILDNLLANTPTRE